ncbi:FUSC family protein [uncultured Thiodictyon sp.]|uniref:FUSC family protein n=1 Tax=uncultured Thiodictyon sp. TaxID=1846217 RepID=UPI0025D26508|nr:FUSC family protein [uncultured Thiodictyon sp.]
MSLWNPTAAINASKTTVGILAAWGIVLWFQWPSPFLAPIAVLYLQTPYLGASLRKGLMRVLGTLGGAGVTMAILSLFIQERVPLIAANALVLGTAVYMIRNSRYAYAWYMAALVVAIIGDAAATQPDQAFSMAVYRTSEALVGVLVVLVVNGLLWPRTAGPVYARTYADALAGLGAYLRRLAQAVPTPTAALLAPPTAQVQGAPEALREVLAAAALDTASFRRLRSTYVAQIKALAAAIGSLMAFGENLGLTAAGESAFLTAGQRNALGETLVHLADAVAGIEPGRDGARPAAGAATPHGSLDAARARLQGLLDGPSRQKQGADQSAMLHAAVDQLNALIDDLVTLAEASGLIDADPRGPARRPRAAPAREWRLPLAERVAEALPGGLLMAGTYLAATLIWIEWQWPPVSSLGIMMAVVIIGFETMQNIPAQHPGRRMAGGALAGMLVTAPIYTLVMPRLTGFSELALVLFPFYYAVTYFMHALPSPRQIPFLGMGLMGIIMLQLDPVQTLDLAGWLSMGLSALSGFAIALVLLGIFRGITPQERLRRALRHLLGDLHDATVTLADRGRPDFPRVLGEAEQRLIRGIKELAQVIPRAYAAQVPHNDPERIQALLTAAESAQLRFRALQHARSRWSGGRNRGALRTDLGETYSRAFQAVLRELTALLDDPSHRPTLTVLDDARRHIQDQLQRFEGHARAAGADAATAVYTLGIAGHYVGVAHALRGLAQAMAAIDWAAWRVARF